MEDAAPARLWETPVRFSYQETSGGYLLLRSGGYRPGEVCLHPVQVNWSLLVACPELGAGEVLFF